MKKLAAVLIIAVDAQLALCGDLVNYCIENMLAEPGYGMNSRNQHAVRFTDSICDRRTHAILNASRAGVQIPKERKPNNEELNRLRRYWLGSLNQDEAKRFEQEWISNVLAIENNTKQELARRNQYQSKRNNAGGVDRLSELEAAVSALEKKLVGPFDSVIVNELTPVSFLLAELEKKIISLEAAERRAQQKFSELQDLEERVRALELIPAQRVNQ